LNVRGNDSRQRASLDARLVVVCETIAQLRGAKLVHPKAAEDHRSDEAGEERIEPAMPPVTPAA
jgi:hypothetical protein